MPRSDSLMYSEVMPSPAKKFHVASSNFPTYHITFMWPMWSHCQG